MFLFILLEMLRRTHLVIGLAVALQFLPHIESKALFLIVVLVSSILPDIDSPSSFLGKTWFGKPISDLSTHRGIFHSYTFCILVSLLFAFFYPILAFPFFLGYGFHLFADSFTPRGIKPFWPIKQVSSGKVTTGGRIEDVLFWTFVFINITLIVVLFVYYF
ncbi:hypothetical protein CMI45_02265 [Candidatus Pacearchaeota archaeon]|nr:hypothetical protein [Candidatus Pacearchaeota archaeon]|tara:strand:+ start:563 stop:1045 length:483 start_codon:yes stop_codon:yes gene_type:complete